jgi:hypothetical protein
MKINIDTKNIKLTSILYIFMMASLIFVVIPGHLEAASSQNTNQQTININASSLGSCGSDSSQFQVTTQNLPKSGQTYIKLSNSQEPITSVKLYFQSLSDGQCILIGTVSANPDTWTPIGQLSNPTGNGGFLVAAADGLGAYPYSSVLSTLIVSDPNICNPTKACNILYRGYNGVLEPSIISHASDQIAVYTINPINDQSYQKVSYYDNGKYLYGGSDLKQFNRNYLSGGVHNINTQLTLKSGQIVDINQRVDMGSDITGMLYIKSIAYQSKNRVVLLGVVLLILSTIGLTLLVIHLIYKHHRFNVDHGIDKAPSHVDDEEVDDEDIVVAKFR